MKSRILVPLALVFLAAGLVRAQQPPRDPLAESFFPPELVMQNEQAIDLSDQQKNQIRTEIRQAQTQFTDLQWKIQDEMEKLVSLIKPPRVDEQQSLGQLDKVLSVEREIKRAQIGLMIRIKNVLTPEQQSRLQEIKNKSAGK